MYFFRAVLASLHCHELLRYAGTINNRQSQSDVMALGIKTLSACDAASHHLSDSITYYNCRKPSSIIQVCSYL